MIEMNKTLAIAVLAILIPAAYGDQGSFANSGGSGSVGSGVSVSSPVATPAGTLTLNCPTVSTGACAGGSLTYYSTDGTIAINATFTSGTYAEGCSGGGKGGHVTCSYTFTGHFSGTYSLNGQSQAITGVTSQAFGTGGAAASGTTAYASAYVPFYYSDTEQILRSDDLQGTNQITYGSQGSGVGQFYGAYGLALDSAHRIYVADTYNCRVVRIDDMNGTNWTSYGGTCGSGQGQFYDPTGVAVDSAGKIYILDTGNTRVVRIDDMSGTNWTSYGSPGSGTGQFGGISAITLDSSSRLYITDTGNARIVRMDDMNGTNWTTLTKSVAVNGVSYSLQSPAAVAVDAAGKIYIADNESYQPAVVRVDDMTGANWTWIWTGAGAGLNSIAVDSSGTVFAGGGGARLVINMSAVLNSSGAIGPVGSYYVFGVTPIPQPAPRPSAVGLTPSTLTFSQNVGSTSAAQPVTISNFGGKVLDLGNISASAGFGQTNTCGSQLAPGGSCVVSVTFTPTAAGDAGGLLTVPDDSGNAGAAQVVTLSGTGTAPAASLSLTSLTFSSQVLNTSSTARNVTLQNTGTGPLQVTSVGVTGPFSQTNTCAGSVAAGASCTVAVTFTPTALGAASGTLTFADGLGTQTVSLSGAGSAPVSLSATSLSFGTVVVGATSAARTVTLTNRSGSALNFTGIAATAGFAVASNTCGASVANGGSCTVGVTFSPTAVSSVTGTLTFTDSTATSPQTVSLTGTGSASVTLSATSLSFNTTVIGSTSSARSVTLTNHESVALNISSVAVTAGFAVSSNTCGPAVAAGATCTVGVTFSPTAVGAASGTLTFTDDANNSPQTVGLSGTGSAPVTFSATTLSFGTVTVGSTSSSKSVTVTNRGSGTLTFSSIVASAGFTVSNNNCGSSIASGDNCTVSVKFAPTATGIAAGTLTFTDSAATSPQTVSLSGTGQ